MKSYRLNRKHLNVAAGALVVLALLMVSALPIGAVPPPAPGLLDPTTIPKYVNQLTAPPPVWVPTVVVDPDGTVVHEYEITATTNLQQVLPAPMPMTPVWGYGGAAKDSLTGNPIPGFFVNSPGATFEAVRNTPIRVTWRNGLTGDHMFAVDPTLHWANPNGMMHPTAPFNPFPPGYAQAQSNVPIVSHLHGGEVQSTSDGHPEAWWTNSGLQGPAYNTVSNAGADAAVFYYPNAQPPTTLWYHDHALGVTRTNVLSGLAGFYLLREDGDQVEALLPQGKYEMPLVIQDRMFNADGTFHFPTAGINPNDHPYWLPEYFGDTIMVNGLIWPNMNVDQGQYRLRLLDGSNARFYTVSFWVPSLGIRLPFVQIGSDGGYLKAPVQLTSLTIAPGERADILVDFSGLPAGAAVIMDNSAKAPFPKGAAANPQTTGQVMQFTVQANPGFVANNLPAALNPTLAGAFPNLPLPTKTRVMPLFEVMGPGGPLEVLINGQKWEGVLTETPKVGTTEEWVIVNPTADAHPIHLHLTQFQLVSRQGINTKKYAADWLLQNGGVLPLPANQVPVELNYMPYLKGQPSAAPPNEQGWKDTVQMYPGEVTVIRVRFAPIDGSPAYPFDPTVGPGYVWHCHILDHEDNEMMRPYMVVP